MSLKCILKNSNNKNNNSTLVRSKLPDIQAVPLVKPCLLEILIPLKNPKRKKEFSSYGV